MKTLNSCFRNINTEEVKTFLKNQSVDISQSFKIERPSPPELYFYDENEIEPGYYNFKIDGLSFENCWIEPFDKMDDEPIRYRSGSYYVFTIDDIDNSVLLKQYEESLLFYEDQMKYSKTQKEFERNQKKVSELMCKISDLELNVKNYEK